MHSSLAHPHRRQMRCAIAFLAFLAATSCSRSQPATADRLSLQLVQLPISYSAVTHIAEAQGYFKQVGLEFTAVSVPAGPDVVTALRRHTSDAPAAGTIAITPVATLVGAGETPVVLATTLRSNQQAKLVTFRGTGITDDASTLRGKRVGVVRFTNGDIYLSRLLKKAGLTERDIRVVSGRPPDLASLLLNGELDAAVLWDPYVAQVLKGRTTKTESRGEAVALVDPSLHTLAFNIVTTRDRLPSHRKALEKLLQACIMAEKYIAEHRDEAQRETERWLKLSPGDLDDFFRTTEFRVDLQTTKIERWIGEELLWLGERTPDISKPSDFSAFVDASVLKAIDPGRVSR